MTAPPDLAGRATKTRRAYSFANFARYELPEHYREYFPRIDKDETGKDVYKPGHIVSLSMMTGEGADSDIQADA
jgi:hypothetical protein